MPDTLILAIAILFFAYLIGSLSSAIILCRLTGFPDPRLQGSGNPGATNVLRVAGKKLAATVLIFDVIKGVMPVFIARWLELETTWLAATAFAAFIGHIYPIFFSFKGGKGVATALGGFMVLSPIMAGLVLLSWLTVFMVSRISSLSALIAFSLAPVFSLWALDSVSARWLVLAMALLLLARHHTNIKRLLAGKEDKS